jgi:GNAT superfamily N-acetyltransferase
MIKDERAAIIVVDDGGGLAGFVSLSLTFGIEFGWAAEIEDLYVTPQHRGAGLARRLMNAALDWADARGATSTLAVVTPEAERSQGLTLFYRQYGFRDSMRITLYRSGGDRASHWAGGRGLG